jgi:DNA processing protein
LSETAQRVLECVSGGESSHIDTIVSASGLAVADVSSTLLQLELQRLVRQLPGKQFIRTT